MADTEDHKPENEGNHTLSASVEEAEHDHARVMDVDGQIKELQSLREDAVTAAQSAGQDPSEVPGSELAYLRAADHASDKNALAQLESQVNQIAPQVRGAAGRALQQQAGQALGVIAGLGMLGDKLQDLLMGERELARQAGIGDMALASHDERFDHGLGERGQKRESPGQTITI